MCRYAACMLQRAGAVQVPCRCRAGAVQVLCRCRAGAVQVPCRCRADVVQMQCRCSARRGGEATAGLHLGAREDEVACGGGALRSGRVGEYLCRQQQLQRVLLGLYSNVRGLHLGVNLLSRCKAEVAQCVCTAWRSTMQHTSTLPASTQTRPMCPCVPYRPYVYVGSVRGQLRPMRRCSVAPHAGEHELTTHRRHDEPLESSPALRHPLPPLFPSPNPSRLP